MADYATLLCDHVTLTCRCVDRVLLQAYVPTLQAVGQVRRFLNGQRGLPSRPQPPSARSAKPMWRTSTVGPKNTTSRYGASRRVRTRKRSLDP